MKVLLVPYVHILNFPFYYVLSFFFKVKAYNKQPILSRIRSGRISNIDAPKGMDMDDVVILMGDAVELLDDILSGMKDPKWEVQIRKKRVGLILRAKQDVSKAVQILVHLRRIQEFDKSENTYIIDSFMFTFLTKNDKTSGIFSYPTIRMFSRINIFLDRVNLFLENAAFFVVTLGRIFKGLIHNESGKIKGDIRYVYDAGTAEEARLDKMKYSFTWIMDDEIIHRENILFILSADPRNVIDEARAQGIKIGLLRRLFSLAPRKKLFSLLPEIFKVFGRMFRSVWVKEDILLSTYLLRMMRWIPLVEYISPRVHISNLGYLGVENPAIKYFRAIGIKTISYACFCSTGRFLSHKKPKPSSFLQAKYSHLLTAIPVVWNKVSKNYFLSHPQRDVSPEVIGPIMHSHEELVSMEKDAICRKFGIEYDSQTKFIIIYGQTAIVPLKTSRELGWVEYKSAVMRDMRRLLEDFKDRNVVFALKQKKTGREGLYTKEMQDVNEVFKQSKKAVVFESPINPWIPIALADITISNPFGSASIAALQHNKPAIFHDPLNTARYQAFGYDKLSALLTHDYAQLRQRVEAFIDDPKGFKESFDRVDVSDFVGAEPGTNSDDKLRRFIKSLAE